MKNVLLITALFASTVIFGQTCYSVKSVENKTNNPDLSSKKLTFGVRQITEELVSDKLILCDNGSSITVNIISIEAPSIGINIGPFMIKKKITEVKTQIILDNLVLEGFGVAKLSVKAGFLELKDENLPFEKSVFASAIKKSLEDAIEKLK